MGKNVHEMFVTMFIFYFLSLPTHFCSGNRCVLESVQLPYICLLQLWIKKNPLKHKLSLISLFFKNRDLRVNACVTV